MPDEAAQHHDMARSCSQHDSRHATVVMTVHISSSLDEGSHTLGVATAGGNHQSGGAIR